MHHCYSISIILMLQLTCISVFAEYNCFGLLPEPPAISSSSSLQPSVSPSLNLSTPTPSLNTFNTPHLPLTSISSILSSSPVSSPTSTPFITPTSSSSLISSSFSPSPSLSPSFLPSTSIPVSSTEIDNSTPMASSQQQDHSFG